MIRHLFGREDVYVISGSYDRNDRPDDAPKRLRDWRHGYAKLYTARGRLGLEWNALKFRGGFGIGATVARLGDQPGVKVSVYAGPVGSLWFKIRHPLLRPIAEAGRTRGRRYADLVTGLRFFLHPGCYVDWQLEAAEGAWSRSDPWWQRWSLHDRHVWGRIDSTVIEDDPLDATVTLPEGGYPARLTRRAVTRRPTRWPGTWRHRPTTVTSWQIDVDGGIPVWGKGENSWDCGMDGTFGSCCYTTADEAVAGLVASVLCDRQRYGGPHDLPRPMTVAEADQWVRTPGRSS